MIDFVCASNNEKVLNENLLHNAWFTEDPPIIQRGYTNIATAYNKAEITMPVVVYVHNDVYLPADFWPDLFSALMNIESNWGVIGVAGVKLVNGKKENFGNIIDRGRQWRYNLDKLPAEVQTVDELLFITKGDIVFDENLDLDFYAADACMQMIAKGRKNYVINATVHHNSTRPIGGRTESFYRCQEFFKNKWKDYLPIVTTCSLITL